MQDKPNITAYYYSTLFYGAEVWLHRHLGFQLKLKIRSAHYRALRVIHGQERSRSELDAISNRATPDEYADFILAKMIIKMVRSGSPKRLLDSTLQNAYTLRRQEGQMFFYDSSAKKIGRQRFCNRLQCVSKQIKFKWTFDEPKCFKNKLKSCFFNYFNISM